MPLLGGGETACNAAADYSIFSASLIISTLALAPILSAPASIITRASDRVLIPPEALTCMELPTDFS